MPHLSTRRRSANRRSADSRQRLRGRKLLLELLEGRRLLTAAPLAAGGELVARDLRWHAPEEVSSLQTAEPSSIATHALSAPVVSGAQVIEFDPVARVQRVLSAEESAAAVKELEALTDRIESVGAGLGEFVSGSAPLSEGSGEVVTVPNLVFGGDARSLVPNTTAYPHQAIGRLWMQFGSSSSSCSGSMIGAYHVLTAGHCIHEGDGGDWADEVVVSMGQDDRRIGTSFRRSEFQPYGEAQVTHMRTYTGWTNNGDWDYDVALLTLDRRIGNTTGFLGYGWSSSNSFYGSSNAATSGYPGDLTPNSFDQWEQNNGHATNYGITSHLLRTNTMDIWPGQSGSSVWYGGDSNPISHAVVSHQTTIGGQPAYNAFTRITESKFNDLNSWIVDDNSIRQPTDRADLLDRDQWFNTDLSTISKSTISPGESLTISARLRNNGTASTGSYEVSFYASTNTTITTSDHFLGSVTKGSLSPFTNTTASLSLDKFPLIDGDDYYIGWRIDSGGDVTEFLEGNNTGHVEGQRLTVKQPLPESLTTAEGYAYAFNASAANKVDDTLSFNANINSSSDVDSYYYAPQFTGTHTIRVGDFGNDVDPIVGVYNAATGALIDFDNDSGPNDDARLNISLSQWERYIIAIADGEVQSSGNVNLAVTAPNNSGTSTLSVSSSGIATANATINANGDVDWFSVKAPAIADGNFEITLTPVSGLDTVMVLWDQQGNELARADNGSAGAADTLQYSGVVAGEEYRLSVFSWQYNSSGAFSMDLEFDVVSPLFYFAAQRNGTQRELYRSNGTLATTLLVKNLTGSASAAPSLLTPAGNKVFFTARLPDGQRELFVSDGTADGTRLLKNLSGNTSSNPQQLLYNPALGLLFFTAVQSNGQRELFRSNGTAAGTVLLKNLSGPTSSTPTQLTNVGNRVFFSARMGNGHRELYVSDGTAAGTGLVANLSGSTNSNPGHLAAFNGQLFFSAKQANGQRELFRSNGQASGTGLLRNLSGSISSAPQDLTASGGKLYFTAQMSGGRELFISDGTTAGTGLLRNLSGSANSRPQDLTDVAGQLFFTALLADGQRELFHSDGTTAGTGLLRNLSAGTSSNPNHLTSMGNQLFFTVTMPDGQRELFRSNGTTAGTTIVKNLGGSGNSNPGELAAVGSQLFFSAVVGGQRELYVSDGTSAGTKLLRDLSGNTSSAPDQITAAGGGSSTALISSAFTSSALVSAAHGSSEPPNTAAATTAERVVLPESDVQHTRRAYSLTNVDNPLDVNGDTYISPSDGLQIINVLNAISSQPSEFQGRTLDDHYLSAWDGQFDVNADGHLTPADALAVVNYLNQTPVAPAVPGIQTSDDEEQDMLDPDRYFVVTDNDAPPQSPILPATADVNADLATDIAITELEDKDYREPETLSHEDTAGSFAVGHTGL